MKRISLFLRKRAVYSCFQPEYCWWKQLLVTLGIILILQFLAWLIG